MSANHNKAVVEHYFAELDLRRAVPVELCTDDYTFHVVGLPPMGLDALEEFTNSFFAGVSDLQHPLDELIAEGDKVALRCRYEGTHDGTLMGVKATGNTVSADGIGVMRVVDGKIAEFRVAPDRLTIMQQIGALPTPA